MFDKELSANGYARFNFHKAITIADQLSAVRLLLDQTLVNFRIIVVSGSMGGRAITFKCHQHVLHLTDMYVDFAASSNGEHIIQVSNRLSGTYSDSPHLRLWASADVHDRIQANHDIVDAVQQLLVDNPDVAPSDLCDGIDMPGFLTGATPRLTRGKVESRYRIEDHATQKLQQVNISDELQCVETATWESLLLAAEKEWGGLGELTLLDIVMVYPLRDLHLQDYVDDLRHWPHLQSRDCKHAVHRTLKKELGVRLLFTA